MIRDIVRQIEHAYVTAKNAVERSGDHGADDPKVGIAIAKVVAVASTFFSALTFIVLPSLFMACLLAPGIYLNYEIFSVAQKIDKLIAGTEQLNGRSFDECITDQAPVIRTAIPICKAYGVRFL